MAIPSLACAVISLWATRTSFRLSPSPEAGWSTTSFSVFPTSYWTRCASCFFIAGRKLFWQYLVMSSHSCPLKYKAFLWTVYRNPSLWSQQHAVHSEIPLTTFIWIWGNSLSSIYFLRLAGISLDTTWWRYFFDSSGSSLFLVKSASFWGFINHLFVIRPQFSTDIGVIQQQNDLLVTTSLWTGKLTRFQPPGNPLPYHPSTPCWGKSLALCSTLWCFHQPSPIVNHHVWATLNGPSLICLQPICACVEGCALWCDQLFDVTKACFQLLSVLIVLLLLWFLCRDVELSSLGKGWVLEVEQWAWLGETIQRARRSVSGFSFAIAPIITVQFGIALIW